MLLPLVVAAVFVAYVIKKGSDRQEEMLEKNLKSEGRVDQATGELVISMPKPSGLGYAFMVAYFVTTILYVAASILGEEGLSGFLILQTAMVAALGLAITGSHIGWVKFYVSSNSIRVKPLIGRSRSIAWSEIDSVKTSNRIRAFILKSGRKKTVIPMSCEGLHSLSLHIVRHVPPERREQATPYLARSLGNDPLPDGLTL